MALSRSLVAVTSLCLSFPFLKQNSALVSTGKENSDITAFPAWVVLTLDFGDSDTHCPNEADRSPSHKLGKLRAANYCLNFDVLFHQTCDLASRAASSHFQTSLFQSFGTGKLVVAVFAMG